MTNDRAVKVKERWLGTDDVPKAPDDAKVDLGDWAGAFGEIVGVDLDPVRTEMDDPVARYAREDAENRIAMLKLSPRERSEKEMGRFSFRWFTRSHLKEKYPPVKVVEEAIVLGELYFKANPDEPFMPPEVHEPLLELHWDERDTTVSLVTKKI